MNQSHLNLLRIKAQAVLNANHKKYWTQPAPGQYPHQWLWDSAFIAIGLRHFEPLRAAEELTGLIRGQWHNGMLPHMIYAPTIRGRVDAAFWKLSPRSISGIPTSPITQPPILAIAVELVAQKLQKSERIALLEIMVPSLIKHHEWLYRERTSDHTGLITLVHPWECGLDNTPPWMDSMSDFDNNKKPWAFILSSLSFTRSKERASIQDITKMMALVKVLQKLNFESKSILENSPVLIQDLTFNSILVSANEALVRLSSEIKIELSSDLIAHMDATKKGIQFFWDNETGEFYSRNAKSGQLIKNSTVATFMPLFSGACTKFQLTRLYSKFDSTQEYKATYGLPSVSKSSTKYSNYRYWQGPMWLNTNWLVIRGLELAGELDRAKQLTKQSVAATSTSGMYEYFDPDTGAGYGAKDFSWTAALILDLLAQARK